ncbi:MAG: TRAP transporter small permease subunit [Anaerolineales bacterium]|jgi:TRAP-type mannitol/chloroaromatic compound transport system permease small subunit
MENKVKDNDLIHHSNNQSKIKTTIYSIIEWEGKILSFLFLIASFQICYELILRYFFNSPTVWGLELTIYLCGTTYVMGGAYASIHNAHIKIDVFYAKWSRRVKAIMDVIFSYTLFFIFCGTLIWFSAEWLYEAVVKNQTSGSIWDPPIWPMRLVIVIGSSLLFLIELIKFFPDLMIAFGKADDDETIGQ